MRRELGVLCDELLVVARLRIGIGVPREPAGVFVLLELFTIKFKTEWMEIGDIGKGICATVLLSLP